MSRSSDEANHSRTVETLVNIRSGYAFAEGNAASGELPVCLVLPDGFLA
jgi:hypothetical protein